MFVAESWMVMVMGIMLVYGAIMVVGLHKKKKDSQK